MEVKNMTALDYCEFVTDGTHDSPKPKENGFKLITSKHLNRYGIDFASANFISEEDYKKIINRSSVEQWDILFSMIGTIGNLYIETNSTTNYACKNVGIFKLGGDEMKSKWLYYYLQSPKALEYVKAVSRGTTQSYVPLGALRKMPVDFFDDTIRDKIVTILWNLDEKIKLNLEINNNLLEQVLTLYRNKFIGTANNERAICRADEYFDISIGKTPPRKETQWFSTNPQDVTWVSISDMGTCGLYISSSSEQLTKNAVERHNVKVVPDNTVLLSFKLTVGRIAITNGEMTTNEAIAHFKTNKKEINEYLYCYLKCFNYQTMGSTSSIATAVNSKIIKGMPFVVPTNDELEEFHGFAAPMFAKIKANQIETDNLTALRDILLPKLISGKLDVSDIRF